MVYRSSHSIEDMIEHLLPEDEELCFIVLRKKKQYGMIINIVVKK